MSTLKFIENELFFVCASDEETHLTDIVRGRGIVGKWTALNFDPIEDANQEEIDAFEKYADDPDSWISRLDKANQLTWETYAGGSITFTRITEECAKKLVPDNELKNNECSITPKCPACGEPVPDEGNHHGDFPFPWKCCKCGVDFKIQPWHETTWTCWIPEK